MAFNLLNFLKGVAADVNPFDGGKSHGNMSGAPRPATTAQPSQQQQVVASTQNLPQQKSLWQQALGIASAPQNAIQGLGRDLTQVKLPGLGVNTAQIARQIPQAVNDLSHNVAEPFNQSFAGGINREIINAANPVAKIGLGLPGVVADKLSGGQLYNGMNQATQGLKTNFAPEAGAPNNVLAPTKIQDYNPTQRLARTAGSVAKTGVEQAALMAASGGLANAAGGAIEGTGLGSQVSRNVLQGGVGFGSASGMQGALEGKSVPDILKSTAGGFAAGAAGGGLVPFIPNVGDTPFLRAVPRALGSAAIGGVTAPLAGMDPLQGAAFGLMGGAEHPYTNGLTTKLVPKPNEPTTGLVPKAIYNNYDQPKNGPNSQFSPRNPKAIETQQAKDLAASEARKIDPNVQAMRSKISAAPQEVAALQASELMQTQVRISKSLEGLDPNSAPFKAGLKAIDDINVKLKAIDEGPSVRIMGKPSLYEKGAVGNDVGEDILPRAKKTVFEQNTGTVAPTRQRGTLNTERLNLTDTQKADLKARQNPIVETMSHKEIEDIAKGAGIDTRSHTIDQTKEIIAKQLNTRGEIVRLEKQADALAREGGDPVESGNLYAKIDELGRASTEQGTDIARQLSARRILADESKSPIQRVFGLLHKAGVNPEVYTKEAVGVNFNNPNEVIKYYRKLVPPTKGEWLDVVRYNSMLSSPLTQIVNVSSTAGNISIAPIERTIASNLDFIHSLATGKPRKFAGGEGRAYAKGMVKSFPDAVRAFKDSIKGLDENMNLDVGTQGGHVPIAAPGQNKLVDIAEFPMKLLGAFDNFHRTLVAGGSDAALSRRMQAGIKVRNPEMVNAAEGAYRTFNQDIGEKSQGSLLQGIDEVTAAVNRLRSSKHAVIRLPAKFTLPFVRIGANLMKQGIEYSPAGLATIPGAQDKTAQLAKTLMGTAVFGTAAGLLGQGRLTWSEPTNADQKAAFRAAGKQPYSMKIGNNWIGFSKLPPIISFNMAMVAALDDVQKNAKINDGGVDNILTAIAKYSPEAASKYGKFLADQSYVKSVGDLLSALQGDKEKLASLASNYPQQLVPERALLGWFAKMSDGTQRKINTDAGFAAKQVESLMQQIPGLRQKTTPRTDQYGDPIAAQHPFLNAFSPVPVSTENPENALAYDTMNARLKSNRNSKVELDKLKADYKAGKGSSGLTDKQKASLDRGLREDEVVKSLTPVQRELYKYKEEDLKALLNGPNAKNAQAALDAKSSLSSSTKASNPKDRYQKALDQYNKDKKAGKVSEVNDPTRQKELAALKVKSNFDQDTVDLYGKSYKDIIGFVNTSQNGKKLWEQVKALDKATVDAGGTSKLYDKYGNLKKTTTGSTAKKAKKGKYTFANTQVKGTDLKALSTMLKGISKPKNSKAIALKTYSPKKATISKRSA